MSTDRDLSSVTYNGVTYSIGDTVTCLHKTAKGQLCMNKGIATNSETSTTFYAGLGWKSGREFEIRKIFHYVSSNRICLFPNDGYKGYGIWIEAVRLGKKKMGAKIKLSF